MIAAAPPQREKDSSSHHSSSSLFFYQPPSLTQLLPHKSHPFTSPLPYWWRSEIGNSIKPIEEDE